MSTDRTQMLAATILKLYRRGATANIQRILHKTHSADIASVLETFSNEEAYEIFKLENDPVLRAGILSYLNTDLQKHIMDKSSTDEASELVGNMESDDAADLLGELTVEDSKEIIEGMESQDSTEVVDLLSYADDTAGGLMSSDYAAFTEETTVEQVVAALQSEEMEEKISFYVYVLNSGGVLVGVVSLKQLLLSKKSQMLKHMMHPSVISVRADTHQEEVAKTVERYDFLCVPVVDENNKLIGVITVDDVIDVIREEAEADLLGMGQAGWGVDMTFWEHFQARILWQILAFVAGGICFNIIYQFGIAQNAMFADSHVWIMSAFVPLLLALGAMVGNQSATVMIGALKTGRFLGGRPRAHILRELGLSTVSSIFFGVAVYVVMTWFLPEVKWQEYFAFAMGLQILVTMILGTVLPIILSKIKVDPTVGTVPILTAFADISALMVLVSLFSMVEV